MNARERLCTQAVQLWGHALRREVTGHSRETSQRRQHFAKYRIPWERRGEGSPGRENAMNRSMEIGAGSQPARQERG